MSALSITLGVLFLAACLLWYAWVRSALRAKDGEARFSSSPVAPRAALMGDPAGRKYPISRAYRIAYSRQVYVNTPFELQVTFSLPGSLRALGPDLIAREGRVTFEAAEPEPLVKVALEFTDGAFEADRLELSKPLAEAAETVFTFWLKPLKSEDCLLTVTIRYVSEQEVDEIVEQIQVSTTKDASGQEQTTTTLVKTPAQTAKAEQELDRVTLNVAVASFLGLNAGELSLLGKGLGALIALILVGISFLTGRGFDAVEAIELLILGVATPLGITVYDGATGRLAPKPEESET